jgi:hypothetical protein
MKMNLNSGTGILPVRINPLIHRAIQLGWVRPSPGPKLKIDSYLRRELRAHWHARGLNSNGRSRKNIPRPNLTGLNRKTYHRQYMRMRRNKILDVQ